MARRRRPTKSSPSPRKKKAELSPLGRGGGCDPRSFFDDQIVITNDLTKIAYFESLTRDQYEDLKKSGKLGATIPIYGVPIDLNLSYEDARRTVDQVKQVKNIEYLSVHQKTVQTSILSDNGLDGYKLCLTGKNPVGTFLWMARDAATANHFFIGVRWQGGVGGPRGRFDYVGRSPFQVIGGRVVGPYAQHPPRLIQSGQEISVEVERDLAQRFEFTTSISGYSPDDRILLPKYQPRPITFIVRNSPKEAVSSSFGEGGNNGELAEKSIEFKANPNEEFLPTTAKVVGKVDGERGGWLIKSDEKLRIIWYLWAKTPTKDHGAWAGGYLSVISMTW
jgi:hypothetical protein